MDAKRHDVAPATVSANEGSKRLQLSVKRMKKLRANVQGGVEQPPATQGSTAPTSWT
jgi:hypothetical protein